MLVACGLLEQIAAALRLNQSIAVKLAQVRRDNGVLRFPQLRERPVEPRPGADTVSRVDGRLSGTSLGAEIGVPGVAARADSRRKRLAMRIGTRKSAEVSPFTETDAGDEKGHSSLRRCRAAGGRRDALSIRRGLLSKHQARGQHQSTQHNNISMWLGHGFFTILVNRKTGLGRGFSANPSGHSLSPPGLTESGFLICTGSGRIPIIRTYLGLGVPTTVIKNSSLHASPSTILPDILNQDVRNGCDRNYLQSRVLRQDGPK